MTLSVGTDGGHGGVAIVLPPREAFDADAAGAIALIVASLARAPSRFARVVIGRPVARPLPGASFVPARPVLLPMPRAERYAAGVARVLRRLRPALVEVHNRPDVAHHLRRALGVPVVLVLNNDPLPMRGARHLVTPDRVVAASGWIAARSGRADTLVLPNPIDLAALPPPAARAERDHVLLFAGRVVADKGVDTFVAACARALPALPGWRAEIIGADGFGAGTRETPFLRALRPAAAAAGVAMPGWRPHAEVLAAMARAAIVAVPSRWPEPFGMTALEAMACGAALAYAPRGGLPEVAGDAGLPVDPDDPEAMAEAFLALACDPSRRAALAAAGLARAVRFDLRAIAARWDGLRAEVLQPG